MFAVFLLQSFPAAITNFPAILDSFCFPSIRLLAIYPAIISQSIIFSLFPQVFPMDDDDDENENINHIRNISRFNESQNNLWTWDHDSWNFPQNVLLDPEPTGPRTHLTQNQLDPEPTCLQSENRNVNPQGRDSLWQLQTHASLSGPSLCPEITQVYI